MCEIKVIRSEFNKNHGDTVICKSLLWISGCKLNKKLNNADRRKEVHKRRLKVLKNALTEDR